MACAAAAAEELPEDIAETAVTKIKLNIFGVKAAKPFEWVASCMAATPGIIADAGMSELVVALPLLLVFQYLVCLTDFFEFGFVATFFIGVIFDSKAPVRLFYLISARALRHT
jgi:hypothetical protein